MAQDIQKIKPEAVIVKDGFFSSRLQLTRY